MVPAQCRPFDRCKSQTLIDVLRRGVGRLPATNGSGASPADAIEAPSGALSAALRVCWPTPPHCGETDPVPEDLV